MPDEWMVPGKSPVEFELRQGETYKWCSCGMSKTAPFCDGASHAGSGLEPVTFVARKTELALLCACGASGDPPFCDGTHNII